MIWLTGKAGMLGSDVEQLLLQSKKEYMATDCEVDITAVPALESFLCEQGIKSLQYIINCAAYTAVDLAEKECEKAFTLNGVGPRNLAEIARKTGAVLVHISTDYVFDGTKQGMYREDDPTNPINVYGKSKLEGETGVRKETEHFFILRTAWLYGKNRKNFVKTMIRLFKEKDDLRIVNDQTGNPTCTEDLARVIMTIINRNSSSYGIYNVTNEGKTTWYNFAQSIYNYGKKMGFIHRDVVIHPVPASDYNTPAKRPGNSCLSKEKLKKQLGIVMRPWEAALYDFLDRMNYFI
jgi:dTDP-4-dehydrorhamnose reductase